jgi:multiple sugar transport system substrate-binding protein
MDPAPAIQEETSMPSRSIVRVGSTAILTLALALPAGSVAAQDGASITFLTPPWGVPPDQAALEAFEAESGISVEVLDAGQMETLFTNVSVAAAAGEPAADVIFLTEEAPSNIVATGNVEDLSDLVAAAGTDLSEFAQVEFWQDGDALYGIPVYSQLVMMDFNARKLADAGFEPPTTWAELSEQAYAMQASGADPNPIAFGAIDWSWYLMALSAGDPMFDDELNPVFADEGSQAREAMAMLLGIIGQSQHSAFWEGTGTFHQGWQGSIAVANNPESSTQAPDVEYLLLPDEHFTWSFPAALGIGTGSQDREAAYEFIQWYTGAENQKAIYDAFGLYPSRPGVAAELNEAGVIAGYDVIVEQANYLNELPRTALWWGPFTADVRSAINEAATAGSDPDQVVDDLAEIWNELKSEFS